jgi:predicted nucleic acid-binding protein
VSYLLDTDILSDLVKKSPSPALLRRLAHLQPEDQFTSTITVGEMVSRNVRHFSRVPGPAVENWLE